MVSFPKAVSGRRISATPETVLLRVAFVFVVLAAVATALAPAVRAGVWIFEVEQLTPLGLATGWAVCAWLASAAAQRLVADHDPYLIPTVFLLCGWGLMLIWRLAPVFGVRQGVWLFVATAVMCAVLSLPGDLRWLRRYKYTWLLGGLALTGGTLLFGVNPSGYGERLWLGCCGIYLQPAEILKLLLVAFLAAYLADRRDSLFGAEAHPIFGLGRSTIVYFLPMLVMWGFSIVILISQRDLGMSSLFFVAFLVMLYLASGRTFFVIMGALLLAGAGALGYELFGVVRARVDTWLNPWADPSGSSYQIVQSLIAIAAGGIMGRGPGLGAPTLIPVAHSDFIFAALGEEWGLSGLLAAASLLAVFVFRGLRLALQARGAFRQLLAGGLAALVGVQALLIMGGILRLAPLTGVTLPFLSYGGSSLVAHFIILGLLLRLSASDPRLPAVT